MSKGHLIAFTGVDGSGKTTQAKLLVENLKRNGLKPLYVWGRWDPLFLWPLINKWESNITKNTDKLNHGIAKIKNGKQNFLSNPVFRHLWITSFFIDYGLQIFAKIRIKLIKKQLIISDRIFYDSVIDQAVDLGKRKNCLLDGLENFWIKILFPKPDLVIYVDCPEHIAFSRKTDIPDIAYIKDRRELYLKLADRYGWVKIDGTLPIDEIASQVKDRVRSRLGI